MVDGRAVPASDINTTPAAAGVAADASFDVNLTDGMVKTITVTANRGNPLDGPGSYTLTLNYRDASASDIGNGGTAIDLSWNTGGTNITGIAAGTFTAAVQDGDDSGTIEAADDLDVLLGENIVVKLPKFTVPTSIDPESVSVGDADSSANPSDVSVSGTTLTLRMGNTGNADTTFVAADDSPVTNIFIAKRAGILNPTQANDAPDSYPITVENADGDTVVGYATVLRKVSALPVMGTRGATTTISGSGLPPGSGSIEINGDDRGSAHNIGITVGSDGTFEHEVATDLKDTNGANVFSQGANTINVSDSRGKLSNVTGTYTVNPSFTIDPESPIPGQIVTISLSDIDGDVTDATFAGRGIEIAFDTNGDGNDNAKVNPVRVTGVPTTYQIKMPSGVRTGSLEMRVTVMDGATVVAGSPLKKTVTIGTNALTVDPESAVPGQQITIRGSGFSPNGTIAADDIEVDGKTVGTAAETVDSTGNINITVNLAAVGANLTAQQKLIGSGSRSVKVTDSSGRVGTTKITVPKAEIAIAPAEGLVGSDMTITGSGFPANDLVLIQYAGTTVSTANTDPTGNFSKEVPVPSSAEVGGSATVTVTSQVIEGVSDTETHKTPAPALSADTSSTAQAGGTVTIGGVNFQGFVRVASIKIGGTVVTPVPAPATDKWGAFTAEGVQVPNLTVGTHPVEITVDEKSVTGFIQVGVASVSNAPADVFGDLGDRLVRVWSFDNESKLWSFYDPRPDFADFNTLSEVSSDDIVTVIVSEGDPVDFASTPGTLYAGTNQVVLD